MDGRYGPHGGQIGTDGGRWGPDKGARWEIDEGCQMGTTQRVKWGTRKESDRRPDGIPDRQDGGWGFLSGTSSPYLLPILIWYPILDRGYSASPPSPRTGRTG